MSLIKQKPSKQSLKKFQHLLRELFQFDCADLDFGIYRVMNYKRDAIERFISDELPQGMREELQSGDLADRTQTAEKLEDVRTRILESLGRDAVDADGNLDERFRETPLGREYMILKARVGRGLSGDALETDILNHLYSFFSRYYEDGDYISKRRYSRRQRYVIPYNGEEVYLHWANSDQYYIKTAENFHDYSYKAPNGVTVHFKLKSADVEQNNLKGDKRFFLPQSREITWDDKNRKIVIPFEYRPLKNQESVDYGKTKQQESIIDATLEQIPGSLKIPAESLAALAGERRLDSDGRTVTFLEHHLRHYTRRNTSDFFIHKDLEGFLSRELDFYLKNEVLNLDEVEAAGEDHADGWFQAMRVIRSVAGRIISLLDQIEGFQKMLWEKRKFVTETHYCVRVGIIDESFYSEVVACESQWDEWQKLFSIDEEEPNLFNLGKDRISMRVDYLKNHPNLVLDTKHFIENFVDRLIATFDDLDSMTDGLLLHSENFQALSLMQTKYRGKIICIYIDPPYNTSENTFVYKNMYKHSSWLSMIQDRVQTSKNLLNVTGVLQCAIDDTETSPLRNVLDSVFGPANRVTTITIEVNPAGQNLRPNTPALCHDYCHIYAHTIDKMEMFERKLTKEEREQYKEKDNKGAFLWDNLRRRGGNSRPLDRPGQWFPLYVNRATKQVSVEKIPDYEEIWPIDPQGEDRIWRVNPSGAEREIAAGEISVIEKSGRLEIVKKTRMPKGKKPKTSWNDSKYSTTTYGTKMLNNILGEQRFSYPKSLHLVTDCLRHWCNKDGQVLDYFAGSGTTGHAAINLNREDGGQRRFILVEMGDYFTTVMLPRIKKVMFSPEWKNGKPKRMATDKEVERSPRVVKYQCLESYEDALNNIEFDDAAGQHAFRFDDYLIQYMRSGPQNLDSVLSVFLWYFNKYTGGTR